MEESSVAPAQQQSVSTATARTLYNSSRYEPNRYDPYYALYDDDAELYRDVGKSLCMGQYVRCLWKIIL